MIIRLLPLLGFLLAFFLSGCTKPPRLNYDDISSTLESLSQFRSDLSKFKGSGDLSIAKDGQRSSGKADVVWDQSGVFKAFIYSPFGAQVAAIKASAGEGEILMDERIYHFALDDTMSTLPFDWGRCLTFRQFIIFLTGRMPKAAQVLESRPDTLVHDKSRASAVWNSDSVDIKASVNRRSGQVESVNYSFHCEQGRYSAQFGAFKQGLAREIMIRDNSRNYISLKYEVISSQ